MNKEELKEKYGKKRVPHEWRGTDRFTALVTTFFGSGMSPKAPGTMGSLAATIVAYPMALLAVYSGFTIGWGGLSHETEEFWMNGLLSIILQPHNVTYSGLSPLFFIAALIVFFAAIPFVNKAMRDTGTEDPGWIVIDEVCGIFMTFAFISPIWIKYLPFIILPLGFGLFRFFDILKPLGIHRFEKFPKGWGVMADDLLGGIYAGLTLMILTIPISFIGTLLHLAFLLGPDYHD
jgi:phosphatidylglycerophosphatase A